MRNGQDPSKVKFNNCLYYYLSCYIHTKVQQFKTGTKREEEFRRIFYILMKKQNPRKEP